MTGLQLVHLPLDLRAFTGWALSRGYLDTPPGDSRGRPRDAEIGYAAHAALTGLFGDQAPRPFVISPGEVNASDGPQRPRRNVELGSSTCSAMRMHLPRPFRPSLKSPAVNSES